MKSNLTKFVLGTALIALLVGMVQSCQNLENLGDEVKVVLDTDLLHHPLMIQYVNVDYSLDEVPEDLEIEIIGSGKDRIYSILGQREITPDGNMVNLGVRKIDEPSKDDPIIITVIAKAPNYLTSHRTFVIDDPSFQFITVPMAKVGQNTLGISAEQITFSVNAEGTSETIKFNTPLNYNKKERAFVTIFPGTKLYTADGTELQGEVAVEVSHFDSREAEARMAIPGVTGTANVKGIDGTDLGGGSITPFGTISLDMYVNGKEVRYFSHPIEVEVTLDENVYNPQTQTKLAEGDEVLINTYNEQTAEWEQVSYANVTTNGQGKLTVTYKQPHLSTWVVGMMGGVFSYDVQVVNSNIPFNSTVARDFYVQLMNDADPVGAAPISTEFIRFFDLEQITLYFPPSLNGRFDIYDGNDACNGHLLASVPIGNMSSGQGVADLAGTNLLADEILDAAVTVSGLCGGIQILPTLPILYRDSDCETVNHWSPLGMLMSGTGQTTKLRIGQRYDFRISAAGIDRTIRDIPVPQPVMPVSNGTIDTTFMINYIDTHSGSNFPFNQQVDVDYFPGTGGVGVRARFIFPDVPVPDCACAIFECHTNGGTVADCDPMVSPGAHPLAECQ